MVQNAVSEDAKGWRVLPFSLDTIDGPVEVMVAQGTGGGVDAATPVQVFTNGTGLTRGPGLLNGLGFTNGSRVPGGEPLSSRGGFTNGRAGPRDDGMEMRRDLINGFAVRPDGGREEPETGWGPRAHRRRRARRRLGEMSDRPLPDNLPGDDSINE